MTACLDSCLYRQNSASEFFVVRFFYPKATLRLVDRSARNEPIMKACVEMEVANTLDSTTMFRRNNMSLRVLKMHLEKAGAGFLKETMRPILMQVSFDSILGLFPSILGIF
jgi:hypothetical protein